jgi:hypothetical protein
MEMAARTLFFILFHRQVFQITGNQLAGTIKMKTTGIPYSMESIKVSAFHASPVPVKHMSPRVLTSQRKVLISPPSFYAFPLKRMFLFDNVVFARYQQIKLASSTNSVAENEVPSPIPSMDLGGLRKETSRQVDTLNFI